MRIILTANFSPWSRYSGGGQRSTHELAVALAARGHEVSVVFTKPRWERVAVPRSLPYRLSWADFVGLKSSSGAPLRALNAITVAREVRILLDQPTAEQGSIVHAQGEEGALIPMLERSRRFAFVVTPRYPSFPAALSAHARGPTARLRRALVSPKYTALGACLDRADRWCPTSEAAATSVERAYRLSRSRCVVIPNGVAAAFLSVRRAANATNGPIVFMGRLAASKGIDTLIEAVARIGSVAPRVVVIGRGPEETSIRRLAAERGLSDRVEVIGWRSPDEVATILSTAALAVLPSREESFGNTMAEAMAAGVPLVTSRVGSIPEIVLDGHTGVLVPPGDPDALGDAMRDLLANPSRAERLGNAGRHHVQSRYSWEASAGAFEVVYRECLP